MPAEKSCRALFPHVCVKDSLHQPAVLSPAGCPKIQLNSDAIYPEIESNFPDKELSWKSVCVCVCVFSHSVVSDSGTYVHWIFRQEYWSRVPVPTPEDLHNLGIKPMSLVSPGLIGTFFTTVLPWKHPQWKKTPLQMPVSSSGLLTN